MIFIKSQLHAAPACPRFHAHSCRPTVCQHRSLFGFTPAGACRVVGHCAGGEALPGPWASPWEGRCSPCRSQRRPCCPPRACTRVSALMGPTRETRAAEAYEMVRCGNAGARFHAAHFIL